MPAPLKIDQKIVGFAVKAGDEPAPQMAVAEPWDGVDRRKPVAAKLERAMTRDPVLSGATYKIKSPVATDALYITINNVIVNEGTPQQALRPFEIFFNSKNMEHYQWTTALTRVMSAVFRKGGDCSFLVEELKSVFDPRGGYFKVGGKYVPSLIAEIGEALEQHLVAIGMIQKEEMDPHRKAILDEKRAQFEALTAVAATPAAAGGEEASDFPAGAQLCKKCNTKAAIVMDGCLTCLNCGESKCG